MVMIKNHYKTLKTPTCLSIIIWLMSKQFSELFSDESILPLPSSIMLIYSIYLALEPAFPVQTGLPGQNSSLQG